MGSAKARWKQSAQDAISPARAEIERSSLAHRLAARFGPAAGSETEAAIAHLLNSFDVRISLAARHLTLLHENLDSTDYEDAEELAAEIRWARDFYERLFQCPLPIAFANDPATASQPASGLEGFYRTLEEALAPHLQSAFRKAA